MVAHSENDPIDQINPHIGFPKRQYLPNLNTLRLALAFIVMLDHISGLSKNQGLPYLSDLPVLHKSTEAVCAFFVLSGYLIIRSIYFEKKSGTFSIKNFYARRALRILPLYYFVSLFGLLFYHILLPQLNMPFDNQYTIAEGVLMIVALVPNVLSTYEPGGILEVLWSIGIEEQFYLGIAPLLLITKTKHFVKVLAFIFVISVLLFHVEYVTFFRDFGLLYFFLICGGLIAICFEKGLFDSMLRSNVIKTITFGLVIMLFFTDFLKFDDPLTYNLILSVAFSMFILILSNLKQPYLVKNKSINYLGQLSYGIYMFHTIVLNFVVFVFLKLNFESDALSILLINLLTVSITFLASHISYKYFESFFLNKKKNFRTMPSNRTTEA